MGASSLSSRAIIGEFYATIEQGTGALWVPGVSALFNSNQESETYKWLGMAPAMREWVGGRAAKGFREHGVTIANKTFEATLEVLVDEIRRDKTGQVMTRVRELAERTNAHWAKLLSALIIAAESANCYDGQFFFDTDHSEGDSGSQSNDLTSDVATTTAPSLSPAPAAMKTPLLLDANGSRTNSIASIGGFTFELAVNPRLTWTTKFATFRTDGQVKAFIRRSEEGVTVSAIAEGSELEFTENKHQYGVKAIRNVGYGYWQHACLTTLV